MGFLYWWILGLSVADIGGAKNAQMLSYKMAIAWLEFYLQG